jgi:hypothetical protein
MSNSSFQNKGGKGNPGNQGQKGDTGNTGAQGPVYSVTNNAQTGTTYTFVLTDGFKFVTFDNANAITVTIPTNASVEFPAWTQIDCQQIGAGKVTFGGAGVTINSVGSNKSIAAQWVAVSLIKTATNTWTLIGNLIV